MGLTDYTIGDKRLWQAGRDYEIERIFKLLEKEQERTRLGFVQYQRIKELVLDEQVD